MYKNTNIPTLPAIALVLGALICSLSFAQTTTPMSQININPPPAPPLSASMFNATPKGPATEVDKVLQRISANMVPPKYFIDSAAEMTINREMNVTKSAGQMLRPIGYVQIENQKMVYVLDDQQRILKIKEGSRIGILQVVSISELGVDYLVAGKAMFAPLSYAQADPPKAPSGLPASSVAPTAQTSR